jgi:hypothetical protein
MLVLARFLDWDRQRAGVAEPNVRSVGGRRRG